MIARRLALVAGLLVFLSGCSTTAPYQRAPSVPVDAAYDAVVRSLTPPPPARGRVYVYSGGSYGGTPWMIYRPLLTPARIFVDDVAVGVMNPDEIMVFDIVPGPHSFSWSSLPPPGMGRTSTPRSADVQGGTIESFHTDDIGSLVMVPGENRFSGQTYTYVRAATCPPTICP